MTRQQRGMVTDASELRRRECLPADAGMAVGRNDQVGTLSDFRSRHELGIGLDGHLDAGGARGGGQPVIGVGNHHPDDLDAVFSQHVERRHAEVTGADKGDAHDDIPSLGQARSWDERSGLAPRIFASIACDRCA